MPAKSLIRRHVRYLRWAELQFLLAYKIDTLTVASLRLDQPAGWTYGRHILSREELTLSYDDATLAAAVLHHSATLTLALHIVTAYKQVVGDVRNSQDQVKVSAFETARLIRNAYAHRPADPHWSIDPPCRNKVYEVPGILRLDTSGLQGKRFEWQVYGGPIALYRLSEFVRTRVLPACQSDFQGYEHSEPKSETSAETGN
jgi:hypothetical protein